MTGVSVLTLAVGRAAHLHNMVMGLAAQTHLPSELIVAVMQDRPYALPPTPFPIRQLMIAGDTLPLAAARNAAAAGSTGEVLVFLDMDCIPTPTLIDDYVRALAEQDGVLMGEVAYLPDGATTPGWDMDRFAALAVRHADRREAPAVGCEPCDDYRCFWSLNFAMRRATFVATGGFDERYVGYGGEDTDFAKMLADRAIPLAWMKGGLAYHQYHPHHMPPVHHLDSVVRNAQVFEAKWGYRTMGHWLYAFRLMGLIDDRPGAPITILRRPDAADHALTGQQRHQPYADTGAVIAQLKARVAA
jgi:GT2 family glycosyltransferase